MADLRNRQSAANLSSQKICNLGVARYSFDLAGLRIAPQGMGCALALQIAAVQAQMAQ